MTEGKSETQRDALDGETQPNQPAFKISEEESRKRLELARTLREGGAPQWMEALVAVTPSDSRPPVLRPPFDRNMVELSDDNAPTMPGVQVARPPRVVLSGSQSIGATLARFDKADSKWQKTDPGVTTPLPAAGTPATPHDQASQDRSQGSQGGNQGTSSK